MRNFLYTLVLMLVTTIFLTSCRTDQDMFAWGVYSGLFAVAFAIGGIIYVLKKIL